MIDWLLAFPLLLVLFGSVIGLILGWSAWTVLDATSPRRRLVALVVGLTMLLLGMLALLFPVGL